MTAEPCPDYLCFPPRIARLVPPPNTHCSLETLRPHLDAGCKKPTLYRPYTAGRATHMFAACSTGAALPAEALKNESDVTFPCYRPAEGSPLNTEHKGIRAHIRFRLYRALPCLQSEMRQLIMASNAQSRNGQRSAQSSPYPCGTIACMELSRGSPSKPYRVSPHEAPPCQPQHSMLVAGSELRSSRCALHPAHVDAAPPLPARVPASVACRPL